MYIYLYPNGEIDVRDDWDLDYKPPVGTYIYEPSDPIWPWCRQYSTGPRGESQSLLPPQCKAVELLYPRTPKADPIFNSNLCPEIKSGFPQWSRKN
jgi:hypothetical protein